MELNTLLLPMGIIPSLFLLYVIIGGYEGRFKEKLIFITFVVGLILGGVIYLMEGLIVYPLISENPYLNLIIFFAIIFSFLEQLAKFAILNYPKLFDEGLPIYGASLGLGFSSTFAPLLFGKSIEIIWENAMLILIPFAVILMGSSTGIFIGIGVKRNLKWKYFGISTAIAALLWVALLIAIIYSITGDFLLAYIFSAFSIIFSLIIFLVAYKQHLPYAMMSRRELRKMPKL